MNAKSYAIARVQELRAIVSDAERRTAPNLPELRAELETAEQAAQAELAGERDGTAGPQPRFR